MIQREKQWEKEKDQDCNVDATTFSLDFYKSIPSQYDQELKNICEQVKKLDNYTDKLKQPSVRYYQDTLLHKIKVLLSKGANREILGDYMA